MQPAVDLFFLKNRNLYKNLKVLSLKCLCNSIHIHFTPIMLQKLIKLFPLMCTQHCKKQLKKTPKNCIVRVWIHKLNLNNLVRRKTAPTFIDVHRRNQLVTRTRGFAKTPDQCPASQEVKNPIILAIHKANQYQIITRLQ